MRSVMSILPAPTSWLRGLMQPIVKRIEKAYQEADGGDSRLPTFSLTLDDGTVHRFGSGETEFEVIVRNQDGLAALTSFDETRVGVAYLDGDIDLEGDIVAVMQTRGLLTDRHPLHEVWYKFLHPLVFGQAKSDAKWVAEHYDEDSDFYLTFLDSRRVYSQGIFLSDDESLDDAIKRKLDFALEAARVSPGQRILDIGAGWGAMADHAGSQGIDVTSLTISKASEDFCNQLIETKELPCRVLREHFLEYSSDEPFDAIVNLGVTEHLPDYKSSLAQYWRLLKPGGRIYLDACASRTKFPFHSFTYKYVFPGNPSPLCLHDYITEVELTPFEIIEVHNDRHSYELTTKHWAQNLERAKDEIIQRWGKGWFRRFQLYLWGCVEVFKRDAVGAFRVVLEKPKDSDWTP